MADHTSVIKNRKAGFEYHLLQQYTAGMVLNGTEVKSLRAGKASIAEAYCIVQDEEVWVKNMHIAEFEQGSYYNHDPRRLRKLLLSRQEIRKISARLKEKGITLIPVQVFFSEKGLVKMDIALARGKKLYDKREDIKKKDLERERNRG
jgi:SsrA-binding protein